MSDIAQFFQVWGAMISTGALLATLVVIIWYTNETRRLRKATESQTDAILSPSVIVERIIETDGIKCRNVGNSPALNVTIEPIEVGNKKGELFFKIIFETEYLLEPGKEFVPGLKFEFYNEDIKSFVSAVGNMFQFPFFFEKEEVTKYDPIVVHYKNLKNTQFITTANAILDKKKIEILEIRKV